MKQEELNDIRQLFAKKCQLEEDAYQFAYDASNDWLLETATWDQVEDAYKAGFMNFMSEDNLKWLIDRFEVWSSMFNPKNIPFHKWILEEFNYRCFLESRYNEEKN